MALPPYLTTMVCPEREWTADAMVLAFVTNGLAGLSAWRIVGVWCLDGVGTKADVLGRE
jgi:hypothetical protein